MGLTHSTNTVSVYGIILLCEAPVTSQTPDCIHLYKVEIEEAIQESLCSIASAFHTFLLFKKPAILQQRVSFLSSIEMSTLKKIPLHFVKCPSHCCKQPFKSSSKM